MGPFQWNEELIRLMRGNGVFTPEQDTDKTNVEPVHSYEAFHTRADLV